jgi:hypothetical protein
MTASAVIAVIAPQKVFPNLSAIALHILHASEADQRLERRDLADKFVEECGRFRTEMRKFI